MLTKFLKHIDDENLFDKQNSLLLAISGGKDSVVLLSLLKEAGFNPKLAHCNFTLRGADSDNDEKFIKELAIKFGLTCFTKSFETKKYAIENGLSTQMAARNLRYKWFGELVNENGLDYILTAHHLDDSFETSLYNLANGTGISGLRGIVAKRDKIVRPMICFSRKEIDEYAEVNEIKWREDVSNASADYSRNFLRHEVVPKLKELNPNLIETFVNTSRRLLSTEALIKKNVDEFRNRVIESGGIKEIPIDLAAKTELVVLDEYLKIYGFNFDQVLLFKSLLEGNNSGKKLHSEFYDIYIDRQNIYLQKREEGIAVDLKVMESDNSINIGMSVLTFKISDDTSINVQPGIEKVDYDLLKFPLQIRNWKEGDTFYPLGMKGKKKLSDFMIDEKIPLNLKSSILVLISNNDIVSVIGYRIDDRFKLTSKSRRALQIEIEND